MAPATPLPSASETLHCRSGRPTGNGSAGAIVVNGHAQPKLNQADPPILWSNSNGCGEGFASLHPTGVQFLLCDGSVQFVSEEINHFWYATTVNGTADDAKHASNGTLQRLMSRNDGQIIGNY